MLILPNISMQMRRCLSWGLLRSLQGPSERLQVVLAATVFWLDQPSLEETYSNLRYPSKLPPDGFAVNHDHLLLGRTKDCLNNVHYSLSTLLDWASIVSLLNNEVCSETNIKNKMHDIMRQEVMHGDMMTRYIMSYGTGWVIHKIVGGDSLCPLFLISYRQHHFKMEDVCM